MAKKRIETDAVVEAFAEQVVAAAEVAEKSRMAVCDEVSANRPPDTGQFWRDLSGVFTVIADFLSPLIHEKRCWLIFQQAEAVAMHVVEGRQHCLDWAQDMCKWPLLMKVGALYAACLAQKDWADPSIRRIPLESLAELEKQGVNDNQVCKLFGWELATGAPDREKLKAARAGQVEVPTHRVAPAAWPSNWPTQPPVCAGAAHFSQWLRSELGDDVPADEAAVFEYARELS